MTRLDDNLPRSVVIISAEMGEGHNAAAAALTEAIEECWPGCSVERLDTMELRGVRFAQSGPMGVRVPAFGPAVELRDLLRRAFPFRPLCPHDEEHHRCSLWPPLGQGTGR